MVLTIRGMIQMKKLVKGKKGLALNQLASAVLLLVVIGILLTVGARIEEGVQDQMTENGTAYNVTEEALAGLTEMSEWQELLALIIVMAVIIALVVGSFYFAGRGRF